MKRTRLLLENTAGSLRMWFLGSALLLLFGSAESTTPDIQNITKKPGDDVTLMCRDPEFKKDSSLLEWRREDSEILFVFRDGKPIPSVTHKSFRNRVFLNDSQMKDGDLSVVLKNVTMNDTGTYECKAKHKNEAPLILISTIHLSVVPPGDPSPGDPSPGDPSPGDEGGKKEDGGTKKEGLSSGWIIGIVLAVLPFLVLVGLWIYGKKKGSTQSSSGSKNKQNPELDRLNSDSESNTTNPDP